MRHKERLRQEWLKSLDEQVAENERKREIERRAHEARLAVEEDEWNRKGQHTWFGRAGGGAPPTTFAAAPAAEPPFGSPVMSTKTADAPVMGGGCSYTGGGRAAAAASRPPRPPAPGHPAGPIIERRRKNSD